MKNNELQEIKIKVNGEWHNLMVSPYERLLDVLRERLNLTGVKEGCSEGECGACTVIMDGETVNSCLVFAFMAHEKEIVTIEGLSKDGKLDPVQEAFVEEGAVQCGFCTPGFVLSTKYLLLKHKNQKLTDEEIKEGLSGNLCRCTGYHHIFSAVKKAKQKIEK